jgi:hypothetical protein
MSKTEHRGRPSQNIEPIHKYTQTFNNEDRTISTWVWDKTICSKGPLYVDIEYPNSAGITKLEKEKFNIEKKYVAEPGQRKPRILKIDKQRLEEIEKLLTIEYNKL